MTDPFNKWVGLGLKNLDLFNKHVGLVLTYVVNTHELTRHEPDTRTRIATPTFVEGFISFPKVVSHIEDNSHSRDCLGFISITF